MILDFRQLRTTGHFVRESGDGGWGLSDRDKTIQIRGACPFCKVQLTTVFQTEDHRGLKWDYDNQWTVSACQQCGFWSRYTYAWCDTATVAYMEGYGEATLREFNVSSLDIPVETLTAYLKREEDKFYDVNPIKFEEVVGSVFREFMMCEAIHVGRSGDGGVDLVVIDSDVPLAIQVKRRRNSATTEPVAIVREFLGAILLKGFTRGAIVTTAHSFSKASKTAAATAQRLSLVQQFDLVDFPSFLDVFRLVVNETCTAPWTAGVPMEFLDAVRENEIQKVNRLKSYYEWERLGRPLLSREAQDKMYFEMLAGVRRNKGLPRR